MTKDGKRRSLVGRFLLGACYALVFFVLLLAALGMFQATGSARADALSEWERHRIAREIARQLRGPVNRERSRATAFGRGSEHPRRPPAITRDEVVRACGAHPTQLCVHRFFNDRLSSTAEGFREP